MKNILYTIIIVAFALVSCNLSPEKKAAKNISVLEKDLYADQTLNKEKGVELIKAYVDYVNTFNEDTICAAYVFKAGEIAMNLQLGTQAINFFRKASTLKENFNKEPECIFLAAFVYENQLGQLDEAEKLYRLFLQRFPDHALAKDAKASLNYLGKSPEELIKMFQEQNAKQ